MILQLTPDVFIETTHLLYTEADESGGLDVWLNQASGGGATIVQIPPHETPEALAALAKASAAQLCAIQLMGDPREE